MPGLCKTTVKCGACAKNLFFLGFVEWIFNSLTKVWKGCREDRTALFSKL